MASILIDGNNLGIASHFANDTLTDAEGRPTGAIFGFVRAIRAILAKVQEEHGEGRIRVNVAWDSPNNWRKTILPSYKASRTRDDGERDEKLDAYFDQGPILKDLTRLLGIGQLYADTYEADDIAGHLSRITSPLTLVSNDRDWLQLVTGACHVWMPMKEIYVTPANFTEVTQAADPDQYVRMKAIMGDKGDDVPGAAGIGEVNALKFLRGELEPTTKAGKPAKAYTSVSEWMADPDGFDRSLKLVDLRDVTISPEKWRLVRGSYDQAALYHHFVTLGFNSILANLPEWLKPFRLSCGA